MPSQQHHSHLPILREYRLVIAGLCLLLTGCPSKTPEKTATPAPTAQTAPPPSTQPTSASTSAPKTGSQDITKSLFAAPNSISDTPSLSNESVQNLKDKLNKNPKDVKTRIQLAAMLDLQGDPSAAEDTLRTALQQGQKVADIYHALGMLYLRLSGAKDENRNEYLKGAISEFEYEVKLNPQSFDGHLNLAKAHTELEHPNEALREYETALKLNPKVPDTYIGLAVLNNSSQRYPYAVKYLQEYIKLSPNKGPGYALLSRMHLNMREYAKAIETGKLAAQTMPDSGSSWYILAQAYSYQPTKQDWNAAVDAYQHVIKLVPNWANAHYELGRALEKLGKKEDAITSYRTAINFAPTKGKYQYQLGHLLVDTGKTEEGQRVIAASQKYIKLNSEEEIWTTKAATKPKDPENYYQLGLIFAQYNDYVKAKQCFEATMALSPTYKDARAQWNRVSPLAGGTK